MKIPYDKKYMKIVYHIIITVVLLYVIYLLTQHFDSLVSGITNFIGTILDVCAPLFIALVTSYLLDPLVDLLQKKYDAYCLKKGKPVKEHPKNRTFGTTVVFIALLFALLGGLYYGVSGIIKTLTSSDSPDLMLNGYMDKFSGMFGWAKDWLYNMGVWGYVAPALAKITGTVATVVTNTGKSIVNFLSSAGSITVNILISLIITFYLLREKEPAIAKTKEIVSTLFTKKSTRRLQTITSDLHAVFSGYIRGQMTDALIMSTLITLALVILKVKYPLAIGLISGFSNIIPYFGAIIGFLLAVVVSLLEGEISKAVIVGIVILVIQQVDSVFINPKVVGQNVELHPVVVLVAISAAGQLFGLKGMILAVPAVAAVKLFASKYLERRKEAKDEEKKILTLVEYD